MEFRNLIIDRTKVNIKDYIVGLVILSLLILGVEPIIPNWTALMSKGFRGVLQSRQNNLEPNVSSDSANDVEWL